MCATDVRARVERAQPVAHALWGRVGGYAAGAPYRAKVELLRALAALPPRALDALRRAAGPFATSAGVLGVADRDPALKNVGRVLHEVHGLFVARMGEFAGGVPVALRPVSDAERLDAISASTAWCIERSYSLGDSPSAEQSGSRHDSAASSDGEGASEAASE